MSIAPISTQTNHHARKAAPAFRPAKIAPTDLPHDIAWLRTEERIHKEFVIGHEEAQILLATSTRNRPIKAQVVAGYEHSMRVGHWGECPEPLTFDWDGPLIDGRHRLTAVVQSRTRQVFTVATGYAPDTFMHMGKGTVRTLADDVAILGVPHYKLVSTLARRLAFYAKTGQITRGLIAFGKNAGGARAIGYADGVDFLEVVKKYPAVQTSAQFGNSFRHKGAHREMMHRSALGLLHALYAPWYAGTEAFLTRVVTGLGLEEGDPAYALRSRLEMNIALPVRDRMHNADIVGYAIIAANADADRRQLKRLQWPKTEGFPQPNVNIAPQIRTVLGWPDPKAAP